MFVSILFAIFCLFVAFHMKWKLQRVEYYVNKCNGPPIIFLLGNALECIYSPKGKYEENYDYFLFQYTYA